MLTIKLISLLSVALITVVGGIYPFIKKISSEKGYQSTFGEAFAAGVFLGAGLLHMLPEAAQAFVTQHYDYPIAYLLAGAVFLLLLLFEHIGTEIYHHQSDASKSFAILAMLMLSTHSLLSGTALGVSSSQATVITLLIAILVHKWAESFSLAVQINKSSLPTRTGILLFVMFSAMTPCGIIVGNAMTVSLSHYVLLEPVFSALAAGTFLYMGTLHGLRRAVMVEKCCDLKGFSAMIIGFVLMAIAGLWL